MHCSKIATNLKVFGSSEEVVEQTLTLFQVGGQCGGTCSKALGTSAVLEVALMNTHCPMRRRPLLLLSSLSQSTYLPPPPARLPDRTLRRGT